MCIRDSFEAHLLGLTALPVALYRVLEELVADVVDALDLAGEDAVGHQVKLAVGGTKGPAVAPVLLGGLEDAGVTGRSGGGDVVDPLAVEHIRK